MPQTSKCDTPPQHFWAGPEHTAASDPVAGARPEETPSTVQDALHARELKPQALAASPPARSLTELSPPNLTRAADRDTAFKMMLESSGRFPSLACCWDCRSREGAATHAGLPPHLITSLYPEPPAPEEKQDGEGWKQLWSAQAAGDKQGSEASSDVPGTRLGSCKGRDAAIPSCSRANETGRVINAIKLSQFTS